MLRYTTDRARPGLVGFYDIRPGSAAGLFLQPRNLHGTGLLIGTKILPVYWPQICGCGLCTGAAYSWDFTVTNNINETAIRSPRKICHSSRSTFSEEAQNLTAPEKVASTSKMPIFRGKISFKLEMQTPSKQVSEQFKDLTSHTKHKPNPSGVNRQSFALILTAETCNY